MVLILDPAMRVISEDHQIFVLHPGEGKRFYNDFIQTSSVFLDIPGARFADAPDIQNEDVRNTLRMSRAIGTWHKTGRRRDKTPSRVPADYAVKFPGRGAPRFMQEVDTLYLDAKPGDLIVIPGPGYNSPVLMAELLEPFDPEFLVDSARYGADMIPARRVDFLHTETAKYEFGRRQIKLMQNRQAIIRVSDDADRHEFYEHAYGDYVWGEKSGSYMEISNDVVDQKDLTDALFLTNLFGAMYVAYKAGKLEEFLAIDRHEAVDRYYNRELFGDIRIEVHSPGFFGRPMRNGAIAGYVAGMVALAGCGATAQEATGLVVQNSANGQVSVCDMELESDIRSTMEMVANSHLWWDEVCAKQQATNEAVGLQTKAKILAGPSGGN